MIHRALACIAATLLAFGAAADAHAYLDPGTGSIVLQALVALIAAGAVTARHWWSRVKAFFAFGRNLKKSGTDDAR